MNARPGVQIKARDVNVGQQILAWDAEAGAYTLKRVSSWSRHGEKGDAVTITLDGSTVGITVSDDAELTSFGRASGFADEETAGRADTKTED